MSIATEFELEIPIALDALAKNEWALVEARDNALIGISSIQAFQSIVEVLLLAERQQDSYAFASCLLLASSLAELSGTTQVPTGLESILHLLTPLAAKHLCGWELSAISRWYRFAA
jgi:hypothetical protein